MPRRSRKNSLMRSSSIRSLLRPLIGPVKREIVWQAKRFRKSAAFSTSEMGPESFLLAEITQKLAEDSDSPKNINLALACERISGVVLLPGSTFSFWLLIGRPTARRGFVPSRSIVAGSLRQEVGGGLCQVAGLLFHLGLTGGLKVVERHCHSLDIYREADRYAPLGLDAAVVFPEKDLIFRNESESAVRIEVAIIAGYLVGRIFSSLEQSPCEIRIERTDENGERRAILRSYFDGELHTKIYSRYRVAHHL
jgi:vancomycin resistance protein VanW